MRTFKSFEDAAAREGEAISPPAGLMRSPRPRRLAMLGWARLSRQAAEGSGYNLSVSELASALVVMGHRVHYLRSGIDYSIRPGIRIEPMEVWRGVACWRSLNSPNLATGNMNFRNPAEQAASPEHSRRVVEWTKEIGAEVVHIHSLEGFGFDLVARLREAGVGVVVTPHNYFALCPQVDLLAREREVCLDYEGGTRCVGCLGAPDPRDEIWSRRRRQSFRRVLGPTLGAGLKDAAAGIRRRCSAGDGWPDPVVELIPGLVPALVPAPGHSPKSSPTSEGALDGSTAQGWRSLAEPREHRLPVLHEYARRRAAGVAALNSSHRVLCPGAFLTRVHAAHGVREAILRQVSLGQPHFDELRRQAELSPYYDAPGWRRSDPRPLRLGYFGNCFPNKGLGLLCEAVRRLPSEVAARVHLTIRASGDDRPFRERLRGVACVEFLGGYDVAQLGAAMASLDAGVFPSMGLENSPFVVLELLHAGRFVIASDLGAVPDFVESGRNGLLFRPHDPDALANAIGSVVRGEVSIPTRREIHQASSLRPFAGYVQEVERELVGAIDAARGVTIGDA